jgi:hypothetical protein
MITSTVLALLLAALLMAVFGVLLVKSWRNRAFRLRLMGDLLFVALVPASILILPDPDRHLLLTFVLYGGLAGGGLVLHWLSERTFGAGR